VVQCTGRVVDAPPTNKNDAVVSRHYYIYNMYAWIDTRAMASLMNSVPPGCIMASVDDEVPQNWLRCDGSAYSTATYKRLFDVIGYTFGKGTNSKFRVPDLRDMFVRGVSPSTIMGERQTDKIKTHGHRTVNEGSGEGTTFVTGWRKLVGQELPVAGPADGIPISTNSGGDLVHSPEQVNVILETDVARLDQTVFNGDESRPRNIALTHIIKY